MIVDEIVSIHAFRGEGDSAAPHLRRALPVSIHAFRGEGDDYRPIGAIAQELFQSTPSGGKATVVVDSQRGGG